MGHLLRKTPGGGWTAEMRGESKLRAKMGLAAQFSPFLSLFLRVSISVCGAFPSLSLPLSQIF